jgi:magnesium chelatase family protein
MHRCRCVFYGDTTRECRCTPGHIQQYLGKISGPTLDRIDIHVEVPAVPFKELRGSPDAESSANIRARVEHARATHQDRGFYNARMPARDIRKICALDDAGERTFEMAVRRMGLSARAHRGRSGRITVRLRQARGRSSTVPEPGSQLLDLIARRIGGHLAFWPALDA